MALNDLALIYKALSDETRLKILKLLEKGELCVCDLVTAFNTSQPKISFHLAVLKEADLISDRKKGKWTYYSLKDDDIFKRFLILSTMERIEERDLSQEMERLKDFISQKSSQKVTRICKS